MVKTQFLHIFCDGGARGNPGPSAIGVVVKTEEGNLVHGFGKKIGITTNNQAEYRALIEALSWISLNRAAFSRQTKISIYLDSQLVAAQVNGMYKVKDTHLRALLMRVREKEAEIGGNISYHHIPRERNREADKLVNQVLDSRQNLMLMQSSAEI